jgi:hypothetical protein
MEWSVSRSGYLNLGASTAYTHRRGGMVITEAGLYAAEKRTICESNYGFSVVETVA